VLIIRRKLSFHPILHPGIAPGFKRQGLSFTLGDMLFALADEGYRYILTRWEGFCQGRQLGKLLHRGGLTWRIDALLAIRPASTRPAMIL
jgi:hypothetical protein